MNDRRGVAAAPWPAMMPDRMGIIGSTQGVNASSRPNPKKVARTAKRLPPAIMLESRSCSETIVPAPRASAEALFAGVPGGGISIATVLVTGG
jgi:hypothetical protein